MKMRHPIATISRDKSKIAICYANYSDRSRMVKLGAKWNSIISCWMMPLSSISYHLVVDSGIHVDVDLKKHMDLIINKKSNNTVTSNKTVDEIIQDTPFILKPYPHQLGWMRFFLENKNKALFLGKVGTGKTKPAIDCCMAVGAKKVLVVLTLEAMHEFKLKIENDSIYEPVLVRGTPKKRREILSDNMHDAYLVTYGTIVSMQVELIKFGFDAVIFDEIHKLKDVDTKCSPAAFNIASSIPNRIGLTGTPVANCRSDIFGLCKIIDPSHFGLNKYSFDAKYLVQIPQYIRDKKGKKIKIAPKTIGHKNTEEYERKMAKVGLVYSLDDVADLPAAIEMPVHIELGKNSKLAYSSIVEACRKGGNGNGASLVFDLQRFLSKSDEKVSLLLSKLENLPNEKVLMWARFTDTINFLGELMAENGIPFTIFDGKRNDLRITSDFRESDIPVNGKPHVLICQVQKGASWEVPNAKYAIFYELDSSHINFVQMKGRNRRLKGSEKRAVVYVYLLCKHTIDESIKHTVERKGFVEKEALKYAYGPLE